MQPNISAVFPGQPIRLPPSVRPVPTLPEFQIEKIRCGDRSILVVREDLLAGGTKQRACVPYLEELVAEGVEEFVYASPFAGFAQVALAISARALGKKSTIFCERDATSPDQARFHEFSELARNHGARTVLVESLDHAIRDATCYAGERIGRAQLPLGFDCESFRGHLKREA
ncbi:MAG TPA: hypothetical protein VGE52_20140, partial [Pirellulales bacterium]